MNIYESRRLLNEYLLFHYGSAAEIFPWNFGPKEALNFAERTVTELLDESRLSTIHPNSRALDLGCAVGRSAYELAVLFPHVTAIDYSQSFIDAADVIRRTGMLPYERLDEGLATAKLTAFRPQHGHPDRIRFEQGDAMDLRKDLGEFDVVHAANLLCRLTTPARLIERLPNLVKPGGQLLLTTPCTWLEEFTPPENWPQGATLLWLNEVLKPNFELDYQSNMPFLIREHHRKFQWSVALATRWIKR